MLNFLLLKLIISKKARSEVPLGCEASLKNDDIYISYVEDDNRYVVQKADGLKVTVIGYRVGSDEVAETKEIGPFEFGNKKLEINHIYKLWRLQYSSLLESVIKNRTGYNSLKWFLSTKNDEKAYSYYHRFELLSLLIEHKNEVNKVDFFHLKRLLYGAETDLRTDFTHNADLCWKLGAMKNSGDINFIDREFRLEDIEILPQALNSLSEFQRTEQENINSKRIAKAQLCLSVILAICTALQVYVTYIKST